MLRIAPEPLRCQLNETHAVEPRQAVAGSFCLNVTYCASCQRAWIAVDRYDGTARAVELSLNRVWTLTDKLHGAAST